MTVGVTANWGYVLELRGRKLVAICLVAASAAVSTILFQTVTNNRILTPSIIGFDALYALLQTMFVFCLGAGRVSTLDSRLMFVIEASVMLVFSLLLYRWLFLGERRGLHLLLLVGVVFGLVFRSVTQLLQRIMDPNEFVVLQDRLFASFGGVDPTLIAVSALAVVFVCGIAWRGRYGLDALLLGRDQAINLGINHRGAVTGILIMVSVLVSASTALVGPLNASEPISFFGILIANLSYVLIRGYSHRYLLPASILLGILLLAGGQLVLENLLGFDSAVGIVIEFAGGLTFIFLLVKGLAR
ncbi:iron chelate uptake ABC transporter family permease subunit [Hoeflea sp. Naph1]|uniref:iron chelate uptake ABC transporter family permease subunit n=1 Tax=Hoeflea sp. Naph1 TaxID=3388653 RepID=UPI00398FA55D